MLIAWLLFTAFGLFVFLKRLKMNKKIDSCAVAEVVEVKDLGVNEDGKIYAIHYKVFADVDLDFYDTPCKKRQKVGAQKVLYYQSDDLQKNHYFKTLKSFDSRLITPIGMILVGTVLTIFEVIKMFGVG